jgi:hypothetical protein
LEQKVFPFTSGRDISTDKNLRAISRQNSAGVDAIEDSYILDRYAQMKLAHSAEAAGGLELEEDESAEQGAEGVTRGIISLENIIEK